ncbi:MAG: hypothetical protein ABSH33_20130 [Steroidobacteraceae bacterium]|jgi:hypothetical protein
MNLRALLWSARDGLWLMPWAIVEGLTLRTDPFGLTEEGAKALLLAWSVGDQVASTAFILGAPDIRGILFLPLGFLWPGQLLAAKVVTLLTMAGAGAALYRWRRRDDQEEAALLATGLLMIAPLTVLGVNALSAAPFLLAICAAASWLNRKLGSVPATFGGWFFAQLLLCAAAVSLHPAGLAYPAMLFFTWWASPPDQRHRRHFMAGIPLVVLLVLTMRLGWPGVAWAQNPLASAAAVIGAPRAHAALSGADWLVGGALLAMTAAVAWREHRRLLADLTGGTLFLGVLFGAAAADRTWAALMLALLLYAGLPWLLRACAPLAGHGLILQRGWLWLLLLLICTAFMRINQRDYLAGRHRILSDQDQLISDFTEGVNRLRAGDANGGGTPNQAIVVASPWPARTSIACKCDGLPLPPAARDPLSQLAMMRGVGYVILGDDADTLALANNFAQLGSRIEVLSREPGGAVMRFRPPRADL